MLRGNGARDFPGLFLVDKGGRLVMCGIAGWVDWQRDLRNERDMAVIERMTEALTPRGPMIKVSGQLNISYWGTGG